MFKQLAKFTVLLTLILITAFSLHQYMLFLNSLPRFGNKLILSYSINALMAFGVFTTILVLKNKFKDQLGFIFLFGSLIKFAIFFIVFQPIYKADNLITRPEFLAFFVPYAICLTLEVSSLSKMLNRMR